MLDEKRSQSLYELTPKPAADLNTHTKHNDLTTMKDCGGWSTKEPQTGLWKQMYEILIDPINYSAKWE